MGRYKGTGPWGRIWLGMLASVVALVASQAAFAQGFMVQPMTMEVTARAGQSVEVPLRIRNMAGGEVGNIDVRLVELTQGSDGGWRAIELQSGDDTSGLSSGLSWLSLSQDSVQIAPLEPAEVMVRARVPSAARGAYFAGIIAEAPVSDDATGLAVRVRFLIPLIIEIEGRPARQQVALEDIAMTYDDEASQPTTRAHLGVSNRGRTFSRVSGELRIERENDGRWRPVTRVEIAERAIIPGVTLELGGDLERRLPSGAYRLRAQLHVDGRRTAPLSKEIAFQGDPDIDTLAYDTALVLTPEMVRLDVVPGATRTTALSIENPGEDPVTVRMAATTPRSLVGIEMGELQGSDLSAEPWTEIRPAEFTIRPGGRQNVRVLSRVPRDGVQHANYYADLVLKGAYEDGQSAGETTSTVQLFNDSIESQMDAAVEQLLVAEGDEPSSYIVQMRLANTGTVHLEPTSSVSLLTSQGQQVRNVELAGETGALLPLARRRYSGEMDFTDLEPGYYALRSRTVLAGERTLVQQQVLLVEAEAAEGGGEAVVRITVVDPEAHELPEGLDEAQGDPAPLGEAPAGTGAGTHQQDESRS